MTPDIDNCRKNKVYWRCWGVSVFKITNWSFRSLNLFMCYSVAKLVNHLFRYSNSFDYVPKLTKHIFRFSNLFSCVIPIPKCCKYYKFVNSIYIFIKLSKNYKSNFVKLLLKITIYFLFFNSVVK
jgi:hypothetical protein